MITGKNLVGGVWESSATEVVFKIVNPNTKFRFYLKSFRCNDPFTREELDMFNFILELYGITTLKTKRVKDKDLVDERF